MEEFKMVVIVAPRQATLADELQKLTKKWEAMNIFSKFVKNMIPVIHRVVKFSKCTQVCLRLWLFAVDN